MSAGWSTWSAADNRVLDAAVTATSAIVGLGNPIMTDDAVGLVVARLVHERLGEPRPELLELAVGGIELVESLCGYRRAVIVDAIVSAGGRVGDCYLLDLEALRPARRLGSTHEIGLLDGLEFARWLGLPVPERLRVYAVEVADPFSFGTEMTEAVRAAVPGIVRRILREEYGAEAG